MEHGELVARSVPPEWVALMLGTRVALLKDGVVDVLATPAEFTSQLGLRPLVSPLRLRGMAAMLARIKRQIMEKRTA